jgi:23S rRNA (uracil1939-C5)-methyltransferase
MQYKIEKLVHGGFGLSHDTNGQVTLIEGGIPGESVTVKIWKESKQLQKARILQIHRASPHRVTPACEYYKKCGGCNFQHMDYPRQLQAKEDILRDVLERSGNPSLIEAAKNKLNAPLGSGKRTHYRQRIRLQIDERQILGFYKRRSNNCVPIEHCLLARQEINSCLRALLDHPSFRQLRKRTESLELLFNPATKQVILLLHFTQKTRPADTEQATLLASDIDLLEKVIFTGSNFAPSGSSRLSFSLSPVVSHTNKPLMLSWETGGFCQVNLTQNQRLIQTALDFAKTTEKDRVLDLFCGMGNFSVAVAENAKSVLGIEGQASAIRSAKRNSKIAGQDNTSFIKKPVHKACAALAKEGQTFDIVFIDPPRQGAPDLGKDLAQLTTKRLIYISCDPATLCRDLASLLKHGFELITLQPIDMFPQTHHIECVVLLESPPENH